MRAAADKRERRCELAHAGEAVEEAVLGPEDDARAEDRRSREALAQRDLARGLGAAIEAGRAGIGADRRELDHPLSAGPRRGGADRARQPRLQALEIAGLGLEQDTDQVDRDVGAGEQRGRPRPPHRGASGRARSGRHCPAAGGGRRARAGGWARGSRHLAGRAAGPRTGRRSQCRRTPSRPCCASFLPWTGGAETERFPELTHAALAHTQAPTRCPGGGIGRRTSFRC